MSRSIHHRVLFASLTGLIVALAAGSALADWNVGDPYKMHYPQLPDLTPTGMDVLAMWNLQSSSGTVFGKILADDFLCTETGGINDIHIWGSWLNDVLPLDPLTGAGNPAGVGFHLSIHADIPAQPGTSSRPGTLLWSQNIAPGGYKVRPYSTASQESFYNPNTDQIIGTDHTVWQYNFNIDPTTAFVQTAGTIYWLDVQAIVPQVNGAVQPATFGWKTTNPLDPRTPHFGDDAVYGDNFVFGGTPDVWKDMHYPLGMPLETRSMDLAFVITPEPASLSMLALGGASLLLRRHR